MLNWKQCIERAESVPVHRPRGVIVDVVGLLVEVGGISAAVGDTLEVETSHGKLIDLEIVGFRHGRLLATPLGPIAGICAGAEVRTTSRGRDIRVGEGMLGRVLDALGRPIDGRPAPECTDRQAIQSAPPDPFGRRPVDKIFPTRVRVIDSLLTLGIGQRVGIFAGAGVGKSTTLGMICRSADADVNVVALIGERGRELNDFIKNTLGEEGMRKSIVVAVTSDQPPLLRARGAEVATAIAEYFRDQGKRVLLVMDSVTRYAMALRETALAAGEPPATKGYPPSVFAALPRLLERTGNCEGAGSITALYTVFVEGDDLTDPIADAVKGILDGHIILSRSLAEKGHFPAVDVLQSVSRLATEICEPLDLKAASKVRELLGAYREAADLIQVGAYSRGSDPLVDQAVAALPKIDAFLRQGLHEATDIELTLQVLKNAFGEPSPNPPA